MTKVVNIGLDDICQEVGPVTFLRWKAKAEREYRGSAYFWKGAAAKHAFIYEKMREQYDLLLESQRARDNAGREVLGQLDLRPVAGGMPMEEA